MTDYRAYALETPPVNAATDDAAYTLGMEFDVSQACWLKSIHFWQPSGNSPSSAIRKALLYQVIDASSGTLLHGPSDFPATVSGWNTYNPNFALSVGAKYRACIFHPSGRYAATANWFSSGPGGTPLVNGFLRIYDVDLAAGANQDSFIANSTPQYPINSSNANNYWIDVTVTDVDPNTMATSESISDEARRLMLVALGLTVDQGKLSSNVDLMRLVVAAGGLGLITVTAESAAKHYERYLRVVRDS